jgi:hypothetical protein
MTSSSRNRGISRGYGTATIVTRDSDTTQFRDCFRTGIRYLRPGVVPRCDHQDGGPVEGASVSEREPPRDIWYSLEEALELLAVLEDARDALTDSGHLAVVVAVEAQVRGLSRRLDFEDPDGGSDAG